MSETEETEIRFEEFILGQFADDLGISPWEFCTKMKLDRNGIRDLVQIWMENALLELERRNLKPFKWDLTRGKKIDIPLDLKDRYDKLTSLRRWNIAFERQFYAQMYVTRQELNEYGQEGAMRRLEMRNKVLKSKNNGPKLTFEDKKEDVIGEGKT